MDTRQLIIYRNLEYQELFEEFAGLLEGAGERKDAGSREIAGEQKDAGSLEIAGEQKDAGSREGAGSRKDAAGREAALANQLIELAVTYGFEGNLWHCFMAFCLANNENAYSTTCEIQGGAGGSLDQLARRDFAVFKDLFDRDIRVLGGPVWEMLAAYKPARTDSKVFNKRIRDRIVNLAVQLEQAADVDAFQRLVVDFYREFGVGKFGLNKAFRVVEKENGQQVIIDPIINVEHVYLNDIVGYELQKKKLIENTEAFIRGKEANNVLLYGDAGTGKSSSVKAILNEYYHQGLRIIEVYKHQFRALSYELEYKYLKAILEGGLGKRPRNVLIYATSNRRHLIREKFSDKRELDDELHNNDTVQEKLSLAARFGVTIYYGSPDKFQFQKIVSVLAERYHVNLPEEELYAEANKWELSHGGLSGRTASQFITHLLGTLVE